MIKKLRNFLITMYEKILITENKVDSIYVSSERVSDKVSFCDAKVSDIDRKMINIEATLNTFDQKIKQIYDIVRCFQSNQLNYFDYKNLGMMMPHKLYEHYYQEAEIYKNYQSEAPIPKLVPISKIEHKITGELVSHYNMAAGYPPHVRLPSNIRSVIISLPGGGLHLATKGLVLIGESEPYATHITYPVQHSQVLSSDFYHVKKIILIRDPRDFLYSKMGFKEMSSDVERLELLKKHIAEAGMYYTLKAHDDFFNFLTIPNVLFVRFEDLLNHNPNETEQYTMREKTLINMGNFLNLPLNDTIIHHAANNLPGDTWNYEPGKHTYWKTHFNDEAIQILKEHLGSIVKKMGYEVDDNW